MKSQSTTDSALKGALWIGSGVGGQVFIQIIVLMILARILSPADFGVVTASLVISGLGLIFTEIGVGPSIVQKKIISNNHIRAGFFVSVILAGMMAYLINELRMEISELFNIKELAEVIPCLALIYLLRGFSVVSESLLQREHEFKKIAIVEFISYSLGYGVTSITLAYHGYSYWSLIIAQLVQATIRSILFFILKKISIIPTFEITPYRELLHYGVGFTAARFANYIANQSDKFIIGRYLGESALGLYGRSYQLAIMPINLIGRILDKVAFPILSSLQDDVSKLRASYEKLLVSASFLALPISCLLFILSDEIILSILGDSWTNVIVTFQIMVIGLLFRLSYRISDSMLKALGKVYKRALRQILYALMVLLLSYAGSSYGVNGVAAGVLWAVLINALMMAQLCLKETKHSWKEVVQFVFSGYRFALIVSTPVFLVNLLLNYYPMLAIAELILLMIIWLFSVVLIIRYIPNIVFRNIEINILNSILNNIPVKLKKYLFGSQQIARESN